MSLKEKIALEERDLGRSLSRDFYVDPEIYRQEIDHVVGRQWLYTDHVQRIPNAGDYFLFEIAGESIIITRQKDGSVGAFYNVCRHRGSRVCLTEQGNAAFFICPYHAWTYNLDGTLRAASYMPASFDKSEAGLDACHVRVLEGLIFICLADGEPPEFDQLAEIAQPFLALNGMATAKLAVRRSYPTTANWKLVVDNFQECYHCAPSHKAYSHTHSKDKLLAFGAGPGSGPKDAVARFDEEFGSWAESAKAAGTWMETYQETGEPRSIWSAGRVPIKSKAGSKSESLDGEPVCRPMGKFTDHDGGQSAITFNVFSYFLSSSDHAIMIRFTPKNAEETDVEFQWYVHPDAVEGVDYDVERLIALWDITIKEDKTITEDNQAGVYSSRYRPGVFSELEARLSTIKNWYLSELTRGLDAHEKEPANV